MPCLPNIQFFLTHNRGLKLPIPVIRHWQIYTPLIVMFGKVGRPRKSSSILARGKGCISFPKTSRPTLEPFQSLFSAYEEFLPLNKAPGREGGQSVSLVSRLWMRRTVTPDSCMPSWWSLAHFFLHCCVQKKQSL